MASSVAEASAPLLVDVGVEWASGVSEDVDGASSVRSVVVVSFEFSFMCPLTCASGISAAPSVVAISVSSSIGLLCSYFSSLSIQAPLQEGVGLRRTLIVKSCSSSPSPLMLSPATEPLAVELDASPFGLGLDFFFLLPFFFGAVVLC